MASWFVIHKDIDFSSDIARDFFLLEEIHQKKIVLIGPRSSTGLFHGPLWLYLNYPAYALGGGNPVVVGWWWVALTIIFVTSSFFIAKKLFNDATAYLFTLMISVYTVFVTYRYFNPYGAMFFLPAFFYFFIRYIQTHKVKFLVTHIFLAGAIIQFQMAVGIPLFILSALATIKQLYKTKHKNHILLLALIIIPLSNFILFDFRHEHILFNQVLHYLSSPGRDHPDYVAFLLERTRLALTSVEILRRDPGYRNFALFSFLLFLVYHQLKQKKFVSIYGYFLYFYFGFFVLSFINTGRLLYFYLFPLFPLVFLTFASLITSRYKKVFLVVFLVVFALNEYAAVSDIKDSQTIIGKSQYSWNFLSSVAHSVYRGTDNEFGYFVYAPDIIAFEGKYAMLYTQKLYPYTKASYFQKKPVTYLVIAPPPRDNPYMQDEWWRINQLHITSQPASTMHFDNGYKIEKYTLTDAEIAFPIDPNIDPGIIFR